jgi:hypothetical protein
MCAYKRAFILRPICRQNSLVPQVTHSRESKFIILMLSGSYVKHIAFNF